MNRTEDMNLDELVDMLGQLRSLNIKLDEDDACDNSNDENVDTDKVTKERSVEDLLNNLLVQAMVDPSKCTESIHELVEMYKPMLYGICADIFGIMKDLNRNDEWFAENAMHDKKLYDAYINAGFTDEQSYGLLIRDKIVRAENMKKSMTNRKTSTEKGK